LRYESPEAAGQAAAEWLARTAGVPVPDATDHLPGLSDRLRKLLLNARTTAADRGAAYCTTTHLLLTLLNGDHQTEAIFALRRAGVNLEALRREADALDKQVNGERGR
jgi:hypothetical protein